MKINTKNKHLKGHIKIVLTLACSVITSNICAKDIAIDVGHSANKVGATSAYGHGEFYYNRALAEKLGNVLYQNGYKPSFIVYDEKAEPLIERAKYSNQKDFMISLHHDSVLERDLSYWEYDGKVHHYNDDAKGFGIFVSTKNKFYKESLSCAVSVATSLKAAGMIPNYYHSKLYGKGKMELLVNNLPVYRYDNLIVLKTNPAPAMLIEAGVIVNRQEAVTLATDEFRDAFSDAIKNGMNSCLGVSD